MPHTLTTIDIRSTWLRSVAFVVGFCMMTIELIAGRVTAPFLGSSLYTWTAVLTSVLAAVAIGAYLGGRLSGRRDLWSGVWPWLIISAMLLVVSLFPLLSFIGPALRTSELPIIVLTLAFSFFIFFPAACALGIIMPLLVKREVKSIETSGSGFGNLAAWNAAGSILGTYATGFFFIAFFNTDYVILTVAGVLLAAAVFEMIFNKGTSV